MDETIKIDVRIDRIVPSPFQIIQLFDPQLNIEKLGTVHLETTNSPKSIKSIHQLQEILVKKETRKTHQPAVLSAQKRTRTSANLFDSRVLQSQSILHDGKKIQLDGEKND